MLCVGRLHHGVSVMVSELVQPSYWYRLFQSLYGRPEEALTLAANCHPARGVRLDAARNGLPDAGVAGDVPSLPETFSSLPVLTRTSRSPRTVRAGYACGLLRADAPEAQGNLPHTTVRPPYAYQPRACRGTYVYRGTPGCCRRSYSSPCRCMVKLQPGLRPSSAQAPP